MVATDARSGTVAAAHGLTRTAKAHVEALLALVERPEAAVAATSP